MMFVRPEVMPLTITSNTLAEEEATFEVIMEEVEVTPFTVEVSTFAAAESVLLLMKLAVVVAMTPFTVDVSTKSLVEVEIVKV